MCRSASQIARPKKEFPQEITGVSETLNINKSFVAALNLNVMDNSGHCT